MDVHILFTFDIGCPWSYLAWKRVQNAIASVQRTTSGARSKFKITYRSMSINPALPTFGIDRKEYLLKTKMSPGLMNSVHSQLRTMGEAEGIHYSLDGKIGNTKDAHRLLYLGKMTSPEIEERLLSVIFRRHFEEDEDITSFETLISCGEEAGLAKGDVKKWLENNNGAHEVDGSDQEARKQGVTSAPHISINGRIFESTPGTLELARILTEY